MDESLLGLEPHLPHVEEGAHLSFVAELIMFCPGSHLCRMVHTKQLFRSDASILRNVGKFSILQGTKQQFGNDIWILSGASTKILHHNTMEIDNLRKLVETCAGLGIVGTGFHKCGIDTVCYNEYNPAFCNWLRQHSKVPIIEGDLNQDDVVGQIFDVVGSSHILTAGVSCQPFSYLGDRRENKDERSTSLTGTLRMAYLNQAAIVILECTPAARDSTWVQSVLSDFCKTTGFSLQQNVLQLDSIWPAIRNRWWAVLAHPALAISSIPDMPKLRFQPSIMHLISKMLDAPDHVMNQIQLDPFELERFACQKGGVSKYVLNACKPLPTATHSWGSQMTACRCGCRGGGFKQVRLDQKGLHAVLIPIGDLTKHDENIHYKMRHILPQEVCMLNGMFPCKFHPTEESDIRLELAGTGQMASPIQSCWVISNVLFNLQEQGLLHDVPPPRHVIAKLCQELLRERDQVWNSQTRNKYLDIFELELKSIDHPVVFKNSQDDSSDDECLTQKIKEACPVIEAALATAAAVAEPGAVHRKGKGGSIPVKHPINCQDTVQSFVASDHHKLNPEGGQTSQVVYPSNGGVPGFEAKPLKRPHAEISSAMSAEGNETRKQQKNENQETSKQTTNMHNQQIDQTEIVVEQEKANIQQDQTVKNTDSLDQERACLILTGLPMEKLTEVRCQANHTVGQFALAEAKLMNIPGPLKTTDLVGHPIPISSLVLHEQIILLSRTLEDFQKCPRQTSSSSHPDLTNLTRFDAVWHQRGWVAWDEMDFYLQTIQSDKHIQTCQPVDFSIDIDPNAPMFVRSFQAQEEVDNQGIFTAGWHNHHWFPMHVQCLQDEWTITVPSEMQFQVQAMISTIMEDCKINFRGCSVPCKFGADCGFQTIAWILNQTSPDQPSLSMTPSEAIRWRLLFAEHLTQKGIGDIRFGNIKLGGMGDVKKELAHLVESHGVNPNRSQECVNHLVRALGIPDLKAVLASGNPWKDLKTRASGQNPPIQIVLAFELQQAIVARTKAGMTFGSRKNKKTENIQKKPLRIEASRIQVPSSIFQQQDGQLLSQINTDQMHANSKGIVVVNANEAVPYLQLQEPISKEGLGMLVLDINDERLPPVKEIISFPANCPDTSEPIILSAVLIQLGMKGVTRHIPQDRSKIEGVPTEVVRVLAFKDESNGNWHDILSKPVKTILAMPPCANISTDDIIDVWDRQFLTKNFTKCRAEDAEMFVCTLRLACQCTSGVLANSGQSGLYFEPRSSNGRAPDESYRVIWLPRKTVGEIRLLRQTAPQEAWIVRNGERLGLRVKEQHAKQMHELLRPDLNYIDGKGIQNFRVGPLPFGTTKKTLLKLFDTWQWAARPGQPVGQSKDHCGIFWSVQSAENPSHWVFTMEHGDVLISALANHRDSQKQTENLIVASKKTFQALQPSKTTHALDKTRPDPCQFDDPWAPQPATNAKPVSVSQLAAIEANVEKRVMASIQAKTGEESDVAMDEATENRVAKLENQVKQLSESMTSMSSSMSAFHQQQQHVNGQLGSQVTAIKQQVDHQNANLKALLDNKMEEQMSRIEALLTKRAKTAE